MLRWRREGLLALGLALGGCSLDSLGLGPSGLDPSGTAGAGGGASSASTGIGGAAGAGGVGLGGQGGTATSAGGAGGEGGRGGAGGQGGDGGSVPLPPLCDATDPSLIACYALDGDTLDGSVNALHAVDSGAPVSYVAGKSGHAGSFTSSSLLKAPNATSWNVEALTMEAWIHPTELPVGQARMGVLDNGDRYSLFVYAGGSVRCSVRGDLYGGAILAGAWTHVACVWDGASLRMYLDGVQVGAPLPGTGAITGQSPLSLGSNTPEDNDRFIGLIDSVRFFDVARTAEQICAAAGRGGC